MIACIILSDESDSDDLPSWNPIFGFFEVDWRNGIKAHLKSNVDF